MKTHWSACTFYHYTFFKFAVSCKVQSYILCYDIWRKSKVLLFEVQSAWSKFVPWGTDLHYSAREWLVQCWVQKIDCAKMARYFISTCAQASKIEATLLEKCTCWRAWIHGVCVWVLGDYGIHPYPQASTICDALFILCADIKSP